MCVVVLGGALRSEHSGTEVGDGTNQAAGGGVASAFVVVFNLFTCHSTVVCVTG